MIGLLAPSHSILAPPRRLPLQRALWRKPPLGAEVSRAWLRFLPFFFRAAGAVRERTHRISPARSQVTCHPLPSLPFPYRTHSFPARRSIQLTRFREKLALNLAERVLSLPSPAFRPLILSNCETPAWRTISGTPPRGTALPEASHSCMASACSPRWLKVPELLRGMSGHGLFPGVRRLASAFAGEACLAASTFRPRPNSNAISSNAEESPPVLASVRMDNGIRGQSMGYNPSRV